MLNCTMILFWSGRKKNVSFYVNIIMFDNWTKKDSLLSVNCILHIVIMFWIWLPCHVAWIVCLIINLSSLPYPVTCDYCQVVNHMIFYVALHVIVHHVISPSYLSRHFECVYCHFILSSWLPCYAACNYYTACYYIVCDYCHVFHCHNCHVTLHAIITMSFHDNIYQVILHVVIVMSFSYYVLNLIYHVML